jgi:thiol-disulfide isomerase/thioredoxin
MKLLKTLFPVIILSFGIISCSSETPNPRELNDQDKNIDRVMRIAEFEDLEGNTVSVSDFEGKVVLFDFWETWCGPCLQVFPAIDSLQNEYPNDFVVVTVNLVNSDTPEDVKEFRKNNDYTFRYVMDVNNVGEEIISLGIPFKVFMDPEGYLITTELGSAGTEGDYQKAKEIIELNKTS